jgi:hypothetical protein
MRFIPSSFSKVLSTVQNKSVDSLPQHSTSSQATLFDDLPPAEREAALRKLGQLAAQQPGQSKPRSKFNWKIFTMVFGVLSLLVLAIVATVYAVDKDSNPDLVAKLRMANTNLDRMALLPNDDDWLYDFTKSEKYTFSPGGGKLQPSLTETHPLTSIQSSTPTPPPSPPPSVRV